MRSISSLFFKFISPEQLEAQIVRARISRMEKFVTLAPSARLYAESNVINLQENPAKINIGENSHIRGNLQLFAYGGEIIIGHTCYVGENSYIWSGESIVIGDNVLISHNVNIIDSTSHEPNHLERAKGTLSIFKNGHPKIKGSITTKPIIIKDYAWINFGSIILKGVTVGEGAVVAAGSVVTQDVQPYTLVAGNPARFIKNMPR